jgi:Asp-tRNA(Asn)/Glu-tRNA(Gln) amidotransferase A subunit family amidase
MTASFGPASAPVPAARRRFSDLSSYDATGLAELIRAKLITAKEVIEDTIRKIETVNPQLNAVICKTYNRARQAASGRLRESPLAGVPFLVKDNATIAGVALTRGSRALKDNVPETTAPFFSATERAGLIIVGVTNMPELGLIDGTENVLYGPTRNPWHLEYSPGGSSGGSAACVAAGILPLAHGTDGGGSIRLPASHCGLFGLKPSGGRLLAGRPESPMWPRLVDGCISRTVRDTATYLSLVEEPAARFPSLGSAFKKSRRRLKIALVYEGMHGQAPHSEIGDAIARTAQLCRELGHTVEEASPPLDLAKLARAARQVANIDVAKAVDTIARENRITQLDGRFESRALGLREEALRSGPFERQIAEALPILIAGAAMLDQFFQDWDVMLSPVARAPMFKIGMRDQSRFSFEQLDEILTDYAAYTSLHNICGTPAMSVPLGWDSNGLPIGSQFAARSGADATLLALAVELEQAQPWAGRRPSIFVM